MQDFELLKDNLRLYDSLDRAREFFSRLGYPTMQPLPLDLNWLPRGAREAVRSLHQLVSLGDGAPFRVFHVELAHHRIRRTDIRRLLEPFYRLHPQGENLFVFTPAGSYEELAFVSPRRLLHPRDQTRVRLWLRVLQVERNRPYRTDLETLTKIRADGGWNPDEVWRRHEEAFSVQRVTDQFFNDYATAFMSIREHLANTHPDNGSEWAKDYTHQLLNRIMFLYFVARKSWLLGHDGALDRDFMRHFWEAYRDTGARDRFHRDWLDVLFFEAFNRRWQNRTEYLQRFPAWLVNSLSQAPFLNGGLYARHSKTDARLEQPLPDQFFELLFERWIDGTSPGLFERYNFTVVESGRFDEEVAVDPEMLGMVYERLVNVTFESGEDNLASAAGIFYTPRTEIDLMCRLSLVDWLANHLGRELSNLLYPWVFAFTEDEKRAADEGVTKRGLWEKLDDLVRRVRVCDPACGSGSFLVGMMLVLDDLQARCNQALGREETPHQRRRRIMQDQLYGVDIMEWAVRVAELRLWLQLVVETELEPERRLLDPLLPNLNLKLRPGDSLVQTLDDLDLSPFRRSDLPVPSYLKEELAQLIEEKRRFFQGREPRLTEEMLKSKELDLFRRILQAGIEELNKRKAQKQSELDQLPVQAVMQGVATPEPNHSLRQRLEEEIDSLAAQIESRQATLEQLRPDAPSPFVWDMAFVEVFKGDDSGFDIVIGNPPYVRQEKISDYLGRFNRQEYLQRLNDALRAIYPAFMGSSRKIGGRADYYVYFYLHGLSLLADRGSFCFITSNSWLDVDFGKDLQEFFLRHGHLKMVIDNRAKRSFARADVNTVIVLAGPPEPRRALSEGEMRERQVRFVALRTPFEEVVDPVVFCEIEDSNLYRPLGDFCVVQRPEFRAVLWDQWSLYLAGLAENDGQGLLEARKYEGDKWGGKYLRAPDIFFTILEKGRGKLVRLGDIAEVRFGIKTGANEFFYLEPVGRTVGEVAELQQQNDKAPVRVKNAVGWVGEIEAAWLQPIIKSPREIKKLRVGLEDLRYLVFMPPQDVRQKLTSGHQQPLRGYPLAEAYIRWGEAQRYHQRSTCASRPRWWDLGPREPAAVACNYLVNDQMRFYLLSGGRIYVSDNFQELRGDSELVAAALTYTATQMFCELYGRTPFGGGLLKVQTFEVEKLPLLNPRHLPSLSQEQLKSAYQGLADNNVTTLFEELGLEVCRRSGCDEGAHPYELISDAHVLIYCVQPSRRALDEVMSEALGLTEKEQMEVYRAVVQLVKERLVRARSV